MIAFMLFKRAVATSVGAQLVRASDSQWIMIMPQAKFADYCVPTAIDTYWDTSMIRRQHYYAPLITFNPPLISVC